MLSSLFRNGRDFNEEKWVVTLAAKNSGTNFNILAHAVIVVEGYLSEHHVMLLNNIEKSYREKIVSIRPDYIRHPKAFSSTLFMAEYEIIVRDISFFSVICAQLSRSIDIPMTIRFIEDNMVLPYREAQYPQWLHYPHWVVPDLVIEMIRAIKQEAVEKPLPYAMLGSTSFYNIGKKGENCVSWAVEKLKIAGIDEKRAMDSSSAIIGSRQNKCTIL